MISGRAPALTAVAKVFNILGLVYVTLPVRIALAGFLALRRRWWHLAAFAAAIVLSEVLIGSLKGIYDRARPPGSLVATSGASFPSGHAVAASVTVVAAVIALVPRAGAAAWWGAAAVAFSIVMGLSRAYLGAHWLSWAPTGYPTPSPGSCSAPPAPWSPPWQPAGCSGSRTSYSGPPGRSVWLPSLHQTTQAGDGDGHEPEPPSRCGPPGKPVGGPR